ncbi:hypothetical protein VB797_32655 [Rivularia sp. UHCC 0363]|nr:hypothetical protein [Rivularia sp. UHCC 0363]MEA5599088.1 hypothetical protein [Rivularia sp. UHCC 0363]
MTSYIERFNNTRSATGIAIGEKNAVILKVARESYWSDLVFHPPLQRDDTG